jgi:outer membrane protein OmpA-like peptidoglycan-associated protein
MFTLPETHALSRLPASALRASGLLLILLALSTPHSAEAQLFDRIRDKAAEHLEAHKARADSAVEQAALRAVDSTLEKTSRGLDSGVTVAGRVIDTTLNRMEETAYGVIQGDRKNADGFARALASGGLVLEEIEFVTNSPELTRAGRQVLEQLAEAVRVTPGTFLIEGYADAAGDSAAIRALSEHRAAAVKASLVSAGIPAGRLFARGCASASAARIELSKVS